MELFEACEYPAKIEWHQEIMYFLLKRFKGGITYSEFYEAWDDDIWALYRKENETIKEEIKQMKTGQSGTSNVPEPDAPEEDERALAVLRQIRGD